ncbi:MAG: serine hydrolase domain-containing protein [Acidimicrobiales bacterium]
MSSAIDKILQDAVEAGAVPNAVAVAADRNGVIYEGAAGPRAAGGSDQAGVDTHLRIASMTKMIATVAALQQVEKGHLDLDAPISRYCPEFAGIQVLEGFDGDTPKLRPPKSEATVKHLVTHTTGLGYWFWSEEVSRWEAATGTPNVLSGSNVIFTAPMVADPGTVFLYGISTDWLGKVVEAASGKTLDVAIKEGVTGPLGMGETEFIMTSGQRDDSMPVHVKGEAGRWVPTEIDFNQEPDYWAGGHGLYSTARDYLKFQQALLHGGTFGGVRILDEATVDAAFTNQIGDIDFPAVIATSDPNSSGPFEAGPGHKWGYGLLLNTADIPGRRRAGSGAWAGIFNTHFWVDRTSGITGAIYTQFLPFVTPEAVTMYQDFETALYASR